MLVSQDELQLGQFVGKDKTFNKKYKVTFKNASLVAYTGQLSFDSSSGKTIQPY